MNALSTLSVLLLSLSGVAVMSAATLQMDIPASQAEFEATWEIVPGSTDATWTWVDHTVPYAKTPPVNSSTAGSAIGATLVWSTPV